MHLKTSQLPAQILGHVRFKAPLSLPGCHLLPNVIALEGGWMLLRGSWAVLPAAHSRDECVCWEIATARGHHHFERLYICRSPPVFIKRLSVFKCPFCPLALPPKRQFAGLGLESTVAHAVCWHRRPPLAGERFQPLQRSGSSAVAGGTMTET